MSRIQTQEMQIDPPAVGQVGDCVYVKMACPVLWLRLDPRQAEALAAHLLRHAQTARRVAGERIMNNPSVLAQTLVQTIVPGHSTTLREVS